MTLLNLVGAMAPDDERRLEAELGDGFRGVRRWCRRRADKQMGHAWEMVPWRLGSVPHEEVRLELGLTVVEYRAARQWLDRASERCTKSHDHLWIYDALRDIADEHVKAVLRFGVFRARGLSHANVRRRLAVGERDFAMIAEWWRDAVAAAARDRRENG